MNSYRPARPRRSSGDFALLSFLVTHCWWLILLCVLGLPVAGDILRRSWAAPRPPAQSSDTETADTPAPNAETVTGTKRLEQILHDSKLAGTWGVAVVSLRDGRTVYAQDAEKLIAPASNLKLYTTAAALENLGADYRWRTAVYAAAKPDANGTLNGDVTLYGRGAPDLSSAQLTQLAQQLAAQGVRRVSGAVIGDETYFRTGALGDGWMWNDIQWYFGTEISALSVNGNNVTVSAAPDRTVIAPTTDYVKVINKLQRGGSVAAIGINRGLADNEVRVWGRVPGGNGANVRLAVHRPALWAAQLFRKALEAQGISVAGETRATDALIADDAERFAPERAVELASVMSAPLRDIIAETNKESNNLYAELLLRTLGKERGTSAPPPAADKLDEQQDDKRGLAVMRMWLQQKGIAADKLILHDGSGLSQLDLITPAATTRLLTVMAQSPNAEIFRASLAQAGRDGTLRGRLKSLAGRVQAKTGTLTHVAALSGYVTAANGETFAFSVICNDVMRPWSSHAVIDSIVAGIAQGK